MQRAGRLLAGCRPALLSPQEHVREIAAAVLVCCRDRRMAAVVGPGGGWKGLAFVPILAGA